jgi:tetratricopeptide (TPR) repeat protein
VKKKFLSLALFCSLFPASYSAAQTFEIGGAQPQKQKPQQGKKQAQPGRKDAAQPSAGQTCAARQASGWGGSIESGRYARAAESALQKGNYPAAVNYAQHLTEVAPNDACNWFLLGYTARLAGRSDLSLSSYDRGLSMQPNSVEGLSGKAQTYMRMGRADEAKKILMQVIAANPRRPVDLAMAGELFMQSGDLSRAANLLERSENIQPASHTELMLAITYMKSKQQGKAKALLDRAMKRSPKNVDVFRAVASYYREARDYKAAIATLNQAPRKTMDVMSELGFTYGLAGMKKEAADAYEKAAAMAPKSINVQLAAAQSQLRVGNLDKTRTYLARGEQLDPSYYRLHAIRGDLAVAERRDNDAVREYLAALAALPSAPAEGALYQAQLRLELIDAYRNLQDEAGIRQQLALAQQELARVQVDETQRVEYLRLRAAFKGLGGDFAGAEADLKQAMQLDPNNDNVTLQYGSLLWKTDRLPQAQAVYSRILQRDPKNRSALEALGFLARDMGDNKAAENYFTRMAAAYPNDYVPYMALGDLYTAERDFAKAQASYEKAHSLAPTNTQIVAAGSNAAIENKQIDLAGQWIARATGPMKNDPRIMRETERYLFFKGRYAESARVGEQALRKLPHDRDAAVYLGYDLYNLGRYDDVLSLTGRYEPLMPREPNLPLLAGHVHRQNQLLQQAIDDFTRALEIDPKMVEALVNRGYVRNDMQDARNAIEDDFQPALMLQPNNAVARLGLAFAYLQLHRSRESLHEIELAQKQMGDIGAIHLALATAYRQMRRLSQAEKEYRLAIKASPDDVKLHMALADTLYHARRYNHAIEEWKNALALSPGEPLILASLAAAHAKLHHATETFQYVQAAEKEGGDQSAVLLATGEALLDLGNRDAAMERFARALEAPDANRVDVRLEFAKLFVHENKFDDARQQVALAFAESRIGEASPITTDNLVEAGNIFLAMHDFDLAERYFTKAKDMGASDDTVAVGLANTYIAEGKDREAEASLLTLGKPADYQSNYDYQLALGNIYNQRHDIPRAVTAFAQANQVAADDPTAHRGMMLAAGEAGTEILPNVTMRNDFDTHALFNDATLFQMESLLVGGVQPPFWEQQTDLFAGFHYNHTAWPPIVGLVGVSNFRGAFAVPNQLGIVDRNTFDTVINAGVTPMFRLGSARFVITPGLQFTIRRDTLTPVQMNQNLFRQYVYLSSSPLFQWLQIQGSAIHESGPFTEQNLSSRDLSATLQFRVGRPWGRAAMVTGYSVRDLLYHPLVSEYYTTNTWGGLEYRFGEKTTVTGLAQYIRSWRVLGQQFAIAQILVPGAHIEYKHNDSWSAFATVNYTQGEGFHLYDNVQASFFISYVKPIRRSVTDATGSLQVDYPLRFSAGVQQETFYNFSTGSAQTSVWRPVVQISIF